MTTVNPYDIPGLSQVQTNDGPPPANNNQQLTQEDFFALLTQQLAHQDPTKPIDNDQMIAQMASFSTIEGINQMSIALDSLAGTMQSNQALQASTLVGRTVLVPSDTGHLPEDGEMKGLVIAGEGAESIQVRIEDENGQLIKTIDLDGTKGNIQFTWDGTDENGDPMPEGNYVMKAQGLRDGKQVEMPSAYYAHVDSVNLGGGEIGVVLNLKGLGGIKLDDVLEVAENA